MKRLRIKFLIILTYILGYAQASFAGLITEVISGTEDQKQTVLNAQAEVEKLMPPQMLYYIQLHQDKINKENKYKIELKNADEHFAGSSTKKRITLNTRLLTNADLLKKTLIHEWSHVYDHLNLHGKETANNIRKCAQLEAKSSNKAAPLYCGLYKNLRTTVSTTPRFLDLAGYFKNPSGVARIKDTAFTLRSPDIYETRSSLEAFAVNMEYFVFDPEYKCRRPSLYNQLKNHFRYEPFKDHVCSSPMRILYPSYKKAKNALPVIDPSRIYQIHYLLAESGSGMSSTFGHSMFRLIVCSPERKYVGPECLNDIQSHLVLSFRAFVDTPELSNLAGLIGDYPSRLFFIPFLQVVEEYNKVELRDLMSYPLRLSEEEKKAFIERSVEIHWSYNGQYRFISNNCAVESMNLIRSIVRNDQFLAETVTTPFGLLDVLNNYKLVDDYNLLNKTFSSHREWAVKNGYLFLSYEYHYNKALENIAKLSKGFISYDLQQWMKLSPQERAALFNRYLPLNKTDKVKYAAAFILLENEAERLFNGGLQNFLLSESQSSSVRYKNIVELLQEAMELNSSYLKIKEQLITPAHILKNGYGIPSNQELSTMQGYLEQVAQQKIASNEKIKKLYDQIFTPERFETASQITKNKKMMGKILISK